MAVAEEREEVSCVLGDRHLSRVGELTICAMGQSEPETWQLFRRFLPAISLSRETRMAMHQATASLHGSYVKAQLRTTAGLGAQLYDSQW